MPNKITSPEMLQVGATYIAHFPKSTAEFIIVSDIKTDEFTLRDYVEAIMPFSGFLIKDKLYLTDVGIVAHPDGKIANVWLENSGKPILSPDEFNKIDAAYLI